MPIIIHASFNKGDASIVNATTTIVFDSSQGKQTETQNFSEDGITTFFVDYGYQYSIRVSDVSGYKTPVDKNLYVANKTQHDIYLQYKQIYTGIYVIDEFGVETDAQLWNPLDNPKARFIKLTNEQLNPTGSGTDNSIIISKYWASYLTDKNWQIEERDLPSLRNILTENEVNTDYNGYDNCELAYYDCNVVRDPSGYTLVDQYNNSHGTSITINEYLPAITHCKNISEFFVDVSVYAYLPSMGQLRILCDNRDAVNDALNVIGVAPIYIAQDDWWSSSEYGYRYAWRLYNGLTKRTVNVWDGKGYVVRVLPFFHIFT